MAPNRLSLLIVLSCAFALAHGRKRPNPKPVDNRRAFCFKCKATQLNEVCVTADWSMGNVGKCPSAGCGRRRWIRQQCRCRRCPSGSVISPGYYLEGTVSCDESGTSHPKCNDAVSAGKNCPLSSNRCSTQIPTYLDQTLNAAGGDLGNVANVLLIGGGVPVVGPVFNAIGVFPGSQAIGDAIVSVYEQVLQQMQTLRLELLNCMQAKNFESRRDDIEESLNIIRKSIKTALQNQNTSPQTRLSQTWNVNYHECRNSLVKQFMKVNPSNIEDSYIILDYAGEVAELCLMNYRSHISDFRAANEGSPRLREDMVFITENYRELIAVEIRDSLNSGINQIENFWLKNDKCGLTPESRSRANGKLSVLKNHVKPAVLRLVNLIPASGASGASLESGLMLPNTSVKCDSTTWKDNFGHSCSWYGKKGICSSGYLLDYLTRAVERWGHSTGKNSLSCCKKHCRIRNTTNSSSSTIVFTIQVTSNLKKAEVARLLIYSLAKTWDEPLDHFFLASSFELSPGTFVVSIGVKRGKLASTRLKEMGQSGNRNTFVPWIQGSVRRILVNTTHTFGSNANLNVTHSSALFSETATAGSSASSTDETSLHLIVWTSVGAAMVACLACGCGLLAWKKKQAVKDENDEARYNLLEDN